MSEKRFGGKLSKEYDFAVIAMPDPEEIQAHITSTIKDEFKNKALDRIKVLEIGFGTGFTTKVILESDPRVKVFAVDNEIEMFKKAESNLSPYIEEGKVKLFHKDALEFLKAQDSDSYDVFASGKTLHNLNREERQEILKEIYRVLKPKGIFINADKYALDDKEKHAENLRRQLQEFKDKFYSLNRKDIAEEWTKHYLEDEKPEIIMKESDSIELMKKLGFKDIKIIFRDCMEAVLVARKS